jgi:hypothetical protein
LGIEVVDEVLFKFLKFKPLLSRLLLCVASTRSRKVTLGLEIIIGISLVAEMVFDPGNRRFW